MLVDTARSLVTIPDLLDAVTLARFYKIRFVHLHMTDDHAWTFPSDAFPDLGSANVGFRGNNM
jgi:N-acetyl-beta-hexosaminidase